MNRVASSIRGYWASETSFFLVRKKEKDVRTNLCERSCPSSEQDLKVGPIWRHANCYLTFRLKYQRSIFSAIIKFWTSEKIQIYFLPCSVSTNFKIFPRFQMSQKIHFRIHEFPTINEIFQCRRNLEFSWKQWQSDLRNFEYRNNLESIFFENSGF